MALVTALSLVAASCGDDGGDASADSPLVQAIIDDVMADEDPLSTDRAEVECFVTGIVGSLGEDRLRELGIAEQFDEGTLSVLFRSAFSGDDELPDIFGQMFEFMAACEISFEG